MGNKSKSCVLICEAHNAALVSDTEELSLGE